MIAAGSLASISADRHRVRHDLAVDVGLAHPARDELGVLGAEVDDEDGAGGQGERVSHTARLPAIRPSTSRVTRRSTTNGRTGTKPLSMVSTIRGRLQPTLKPRLAMEIT